MNRGFLSVTKKLLQRRPHGLTRISESPVLDGVALYDVRRSRHDSSTADLHDLLRPLGRRPLGRRPLLDLTPGLGRDSTTARSSATYSPLPRYFPAAFGPMDHRAMLLPMGQNNLLVRWAGTEPEKKSFHMDPSLMACELFSMLKCVDMQNLKDAPPPSFWVTLATGSFQLAVPLLELFGGYSPMLTMAQLYVAAITLGFSGGKRWGLGISEQKVPDRSWDTMISACTPAGLGVLGLMMPVPLGFLTIGLGTIASLYLDFKLCAFPPWALSAATFIAVSTLVGLFLALTAYLLFNGSEKKKKSKKEAPAKGKKEEEEAEDDGEGEDGQSGDKEK